VKTVDKYEYNLKLDQVKELIDQMDYVSAAAIADDINWHKVRNINTLGMIGHMYEKLDRLEDAKEIYQLAYDRAPAGRNALYRLTRIAIASGNVEEAEEYFHAFCENAPRDRMRYALAYQISCMKGEPIEMRIAILEDLKKKEYTEEWGYELAYLYYQAGQAENCVEACDELILWFGDGEYVRKALELKRCFRPLSEEQEARYQQILKEEKAKQEPEQEEQEQADRQAPEEESVSPEDQYAGKFDANTLRDELQENISQLQSAQEKDVLDSTMDTIRRMVSDVPGIDGKLVGAASGSTEEITASVNEMLKKNDSRIREKGAEQAAEAKNVDDVMAAWESTRAKAEEAIAAARKAEFDQSKTRALKEAGEIMERLKEIIPQLQADIVPEKADVIGEQDAREAAMEEERAAALAKQREAEEAERRAAEEAERAAAEAEQAAKEAEKRAAAERERAAEAEEAAQAAEKAAEEAREAARAAEQAAAEAEKALAAKEAAEEEMARAAVRAEKEARRAEAAQRAARKAAELEAEKTEQARRIQQEADRKAAEEAAHAAAEAEARAAAEAAAQAAEEAREAAQTAAETVAGQAAENAEKYGDLTKTEEPAAEEAGVSEPEATGEISPEEAGEAAEEETEAAALREEPDLEAVLLAETEASEAVLAEASEKETGTVPEQQQTEEKPEADAEEMSEPAETQNPSADAEGASGPDAEETEEAVPFEENGAAQQPAETESAEKQGTEAAETAAQESEPEAADGETAGDSAEIRREELPEEFRAEVINPLEEVVLDETDQLSDLTEEQQERFSYFLKVQTMPTQIHEALEEVQKKSGNSITSLRGNITISGVEGTGKTVLATSLIKTIQELRKDEESQIGKISAASLNGKRRFEDLLPQLDGGYLIIEHAGELNPETVEHIDSVMEKDTRGLTVILEDTAEGMENVLSCSSRFAKKFTAQIAIPEFGIRELVEFGKSYAREMECAIDEMGVLAMYNRISNILTAKHVPSLAEVKDIVDEAIESAENGKSKKKFGRFFTKRYNENDFLILREQDFEKENQ
jgi:tetratricopeptide (TPR) repeat protein